MSTIILKWSHCPDLIVFRYLCFKIGKSEPRVAYKSVAYKRKSVYVKERKNDDIRWQQRDFTCIIENDTECDSKD